MTPSPTIARLIVSVRSLETALSFYQKIVGLKVSRATEDLAWLATDDGVEILLHQRRSAPSDLAVAIGFTVDDVDELVHLWAEEGGQVVDPPLNQPWGERMAVIRDPDGHLLCISGRQEVSPAAPALP